MKLRHLEIGFCGRIGRKIRQHHEKDGSSVVVVACLTKIPIFC